MSESPVVVQRLYQLSTSHPNLSLVQYICNGLTFGFDIGYSGPISPGASKNLRSAYDHSSEVNEALNKELTRGHTLGPYHIPPFKNFHISPKKDGFYRLILDLSSPRGESINDGIDPEEYSVHYTSFDEAVDMVRLAGQGAYMAKIDIKHAFRICPVRMEDLPLLGIKWKGLFYVDTRLPFGSRSSPFIFNQLADLLCWLIITACRIACVVHYLDDYFIVAPSFKRCSDNVSCILNLFSYLGVPVAEDKLEGPATCITFLGITVDSLSRSIRLPQDKVIALKSLLSSFITKRRCQKRELLSLIGKLSFAAKVIKPGRLFLRHLINLSTTVSNLNHYLSLNRDTREDLKWWLQALETFNGVSYFQEPFVSSDDLSLFTDAAASLGVGGVYGSSWFSHSWPDHLKHIEDINYLELYGIIIAFELWGHHFRNRQIKVFTDSEVICNLWRSHAVRDTNILRLMRFLYFKALSYNCNILLVHIPGHHNVIADRLSRLQVSRMLREFPGMDRHPTLVPSHIWHI